MRRRRTNGLGETYGRQGDSIVAWILTRSAKLRPGRWIRSLSKGKTESEQGCPGLTAIHCICVLLCYGVIAMNTKRMKDYWQALLHKYTFVLHTPLMFREISYTRPTPPPEIPRIRRRSCRRVNNAEICRDMLATNDCLHCFQRSERAITTYEALFDFIIRYGEAAIFQK